MSSNKSQEKTTGRVIENSCVNLSISQCIMYHTLILDHNQTLNMAYMWRRLNNINKTACIKLHKQMHAVISACMTVTVDFTCTSELTLVMNV